jgi:hypothetical protein
MVPSFQMGKSATTLKCLHQSSARVVNRDVGWIEAAPVGEDTEEGMLNSLAEWQFPDETMGSSCIVGMYALECEHCHRWKPLREVVSIL